MRRRLAVVALLAVLVTLVAAVTLDWWSGRRVDAVVARLEKRFGRLDGRSIGAWRVAAEQNSARFVRAAVALTVRDRDDGKVLASLAQHETSPASSPVPEDVRAFLDANREAIQLAAEATTLHEASWDADYAGGWNVPHYLIVRTLGNAIYAAAMLDLKADRPDDASGKIAAGLAVSASLRREPALIAQLIRISIAIRQCEGAKNLITRSEPSAGALEHLARVLVDNRETDPIRVALPGEVALQNAAFLKIDRGEATDIFDLRESPFWFGRIGRPFVRLARLHYLQEMERLIDVEGGARPRAPFPNRPRYARWNWRSPGSSIVSGLERAVESGDTHNSVLGVAELGVALRRYRLDRGSYPAELSALVPGYLPRVPLDPVTGRPPAYVRSGTGFTLKAETVPTDSTANAALEWVVAR